MSVAGTFDSQITFLYYRDLAAVARFYEGTMGFDLVEDQGWAKIYRTAESAFLGIVAGERGFHQPQDRNAVLITLVVEDVAGWYERLRCMGVNLLSELQERREIEIRCFFFQDPGGYTFEVQQFLRPDLIGVFHRTASPSAARDRSQEAIEMEYRTLGRTGVQVPLRGHGTPTTLP